jgi:hypothetical protein
MVTMAGRILHFYARYPFGAAAILVFAIVMAWYGDWSYRDGGRRRLWVRWVITAIILDFAFDWAAPFINGWLLFELWAPIPILATATAIHIAHRWSQPSTVRIGAASLVFTFFQVLTPPGIS